MTKEQEEAIEDLKSLSPSESSIDKVLFLIKEQQKKNKKKDKIIEEMAEKLNQAYFDEDKFCIWFEKMMGVQQKMDYGYVVDLIKQYFENKVKE